MSELDPVLLSFVIAGLILVAVAAGTWSIFAGRIAAVDLYRRRLNHHAPTPGRGARPGSSCGSDAEMHRNAKTIQVRRRSKSGLSVRTALDQAGLSAPLWSVPLAVLLCIAGLAALAHLMGLAPAFAGIFGLATGPGLLLAVLRILRMRRRKAMEKDFPGALDVIVRGVKSGLPLNDCLRIVAREVPDPLRSEFARLVEQQAHGLPIADAVDRLADRVPLTEVNFFAIVIGLQTKTGGRLAESLDNLVTVLRARIQLRAKVRSMSSEAKASGGIIAALPVVVTFIVYLTSPDYIGMLVTEPVGNVVLIGSAVWMLIGVLVMRKMIQFNY